MSRQVVESGLDRTAVGDNFRPLTLLDLQLVAGPNGQGESKEFSRGNQSRVLISRDLCKHNAVDPPEVDLESSRGGHSDGRPVYILGRAIGENGASVIKTELIPRAWKSMDKATDVFLGVFLSRGSDVKAS